jgi:hypothetical protein
LAKPNPTTRPAASGHRFGPNLHCDECGRSWDQHQHEPIPCERSREIRSREAAIEAAPEILEAASLSDDIDD